MKLLQTPDAHSTQGRTTVRTRDATGVEETSETLHGLTASEAEQFDREWAERGGGACGTPAAGQRRGTRGWLPRLSFGGFGGGGSRGGSDDGGSGGGCSAGNTSGPRTIEIL